MGKRLKHQKRGKGSQTYTATKRSMAKAEYNTLDERQAQGLVRAQVQGFLIDPLHSALLARVLYEDGSRGFLVAAESLQLNQEIQLGKKGELGIGNILPLSEIPEGCPIFAIEKTPGDGGLLVRSSGLYALIVTKDKRKAFVKLPSGKTAAVDLRSRATVGCAAGGGRREKPFIKAGAKFKALKAKGKPYPRLRGVAMNALDHPFGGSQHHPGKSKSTSRHAAPGRKVGAIAASRTGRRKK